MNEAQAIPILIHYHHGWLVWILFFAGEALHVALQVDDMARKAGTTRRLILNSIGIRVAFRGFVCAMIFLLIWSHPEIITQISGLFGHKVGPDEAAVFAIPMNNAIAGLYGAFLDSILGYIPILKSQLPDVTVTEIKTTDTVTRTVQTTQKP